MLEHALGAKEVGFQKLRARPVTRMLLHAYVMIKGKWGKKGCIFSLTLPIRGLAASPAVCLTVLCNTHCPRAKRLSDWHIPILIAKGSGGRMRQPVSSTRPARSDLYQFLESCRNEPSTALKLRQQHMLLPATQVLLRLDP